MPRPRKHDWRKLLDTAGADSFEFTLVRGMDYDCSDKIMVQEVRNHASSRGDVLLHIDCGDGEVRVYGEPKPPTMGARRSKYGAVKTKVDGVTFDSKKEANRYRELKLLLQAGKIANLLRQPQFPIVINEVKCGKYVADFSYVDERGQLAVEDVKGMRTAVYRLKKKLVEAIYHIKITEI